MISRTNLVPRERYLSRLRSLQGFPAIKALVGIRRCGKTTILRELMYEMLDAGTSESKIYWRNLDDVTLGLTGPLDLLGDITEKVGDYEGSYIFLDEVQMLPQWERAVSKLYESGADVYITGSNSKMMSTELSTSLSGRFIQIDVYPPIFSEYLQFRRGSGKDVEALFDDFVRTGSFPQVASLVDISPENIVGMLTGIYNTIYVKDVIERRKLRDASLLTPIILFMMKNLGNRTSMRSIANYLISSGHKVTQDTVKSYVDAMEAARLVIRARRMDSKSKEYLSTTDKYYIADTGIRNNIVSFMPTDMSGIMENIVFNELLVRYGDVAVCDVDGMEVDFVANPTTSPRYFQVCMDMTELATVEREVRSLKAVGDNYPKTIITYRKYVLDDIEGIRVVGIIDWLLEEDR